jgi:hypothetical protein
MGENPLRNGSLLIQISPILIIHLSAFSRRLIFRFPSKEIWRFLDHDSRNLGELESFPSDPELECLLPQLGLEFHPINWLMRMSTSMLSLFA